MCFETRLHILYKLLDIKIVQDDCGVVNTRGTEKRGVGRKKGYMYARYCDVLVQLVRYDIFDSYPAFCWLMNTKWPILHFAQPPVTS